MISMGKSIRQKWVKVVSESDNISGVHLKNVLRNRRFDLKWIVENNDARVSQVKQSFRIGDSIPFHTPDKTSELLKDPRYTIDDANPLEKHVCEYPGLELNMSEKNYS